MCFEIHSFSQVKTVSVAPADTRNQPHVLTVILFGMLDQPPARQTQRLSLIGNISLRGHALNMASAPEANILNQRQHRLTVVS
jgi:hypothetical protein